MIKKDFKVSSFQKIYKVMEQTSSGKWKPTGVFRVRKRYKENQRWKTCTRTFDNFEDAKSFSRTSYQPELVQRHQESTAFTEAFRRFMVHKERDMKRSKGTIVGYWNRYVHLRFFEAFRMNQISSKHIDAWLSLLTDPEYLKGQQGSRKSYSHEYVLLSCFLRYYRNYEDESFVIPLLDRHRARATARSKTDQKEVLYLNNEEEMTFLTELQDHSVYRDIALFQLHTGVRVGEAAALEFRNIDFSRNEVRIVQHLHWERFKGGQIFLVPGTKTGPSRNVLLTKECREMLLRRKFGSPSSIVFPGASSNGWLYYRSIQEAYDRVFRKLGLPHRGTHSLRHTFAVRYLDETKDIYALQKLLGHTDLKVTQVYAKYSNESVRRSFQFFRGGMSESEAPVTKLVTNSSS